MPEFEIQHSNHNTQLWQVWERVPHPNLERLLTSKDLLITLSHNHPPYKVVIGVPHQAAVGVMRICERRLDKHGKVKARKADDNVASFALVIFSRLKAHDIPCKLVIMAHPTTHDPNKIVDSPYCQEIFSQETKLLFECHASGSRRHLDLELSAGSNRLGQPVPFGQRLGSTLEYRYSLGMQTKAGRSSALILQPDGTAIDGSLQLPAIKTTSLTEAGRQGIPALHLEAKPRFRVPKGLSNSVSDDGLILGRAIADTMIHLWTRFTGFTR